jgi:multimeric flavodoxin WrbA
MKNGINVYSKTGNTRSVAEKLKDGLSKAGNEVALEEVTTVGDPGSEPQKIELKDVPGTEGYDAVVFAAPVCAFSVCNVMMLYLGRVQTLKVKKWAVRTQSFKAWLGGNGAVKWMKRACAAKGGAVSKTGVINWKNPKRDEQIDALVKDFSSL